MARDLVRAIGHLTRYTRRIRELAPDLYEARTEVYEKSPPAPILRTRTPYDRTRKAKADGAQ